jgi:AraC family transcriptional regulator
MSSTVPAPVEPTSPHRQAVESVIEEVAGRLDERFSLEELASLVFFSPFHFHRIFRQVTGVPPGRFFGALRIEAAKRLLLTSDLTVAEICLEVGYRSNGTFTSQFSRLVGVSPRTFRNLGRANGSFAAEAAALELPPPSQGATLAVTGRLKVEGGDGPRLAAVSLFPTPLAEGRPVACALAAAPGRYELRADRGGSFYALAVTLEPASDPRCLLLPGADLRVAVTREPVRLRPGASPRTLDLVLRPRRLIDPPILVPPALLAVAPANGRAA